MRVLLIEDEPTLRSGIEAALGTVGWQCEAVDTCALGLAAAASRPFDAVVLDRTLPDGEGLTLLQRLRELDVCTPVLVLSALSGTQDRVSGLQGGADDYLGKPFSMDELLARLTALHRRTGASPHPEVLVVADLQIWRKWRAATRAGNRLDLTDSEYRLLLLLAEAPGQVVTRATILREVLGWRAEVDPGTAVVEVAVNRLRQKLDRPFGSPLLHTLRGRGYVLSAEPPAGAVP